MRESIFKIYSSSARNDLQAFLKFMFRVDFIDDYSGLKPLIDYKALSELIKLNEGTLDPDTVKLFRKRYNAEHEPPTALRRS
jgi:hypothetical protein